ncbi:MAG: SMC-Scp complex subunit ScpB [Alphaproteobacteria bacterium]
MTPDFAHIRIAEALIFAAEAPVPEGELAARLPEGVDLRALLAELVEHYRGRGVELVAVAGGWTFRTAGDIAPVLRIERPQPKRMSRAAMETLAVIAYHQPVTRPEIEEVRGVSLGRGTLDVLLEAGWIRPGKRREAPGRPLTWVTTDGFLEQFSLNALADLPGIEEIRAAGLLDARPAAAAIGPGEDAALREALPTEDEQAAEDLDRK